MRVALTGGEVDLESGRAVRGVRAERLTARERELLAYLVERAGRDVPRDELLARVWGYAPTARTRAVDNMVRKLRAKIELDPEHPRHVVTVAGGYRFDPVRTPGPDERYAAPLLGREALVAEVEGLLGGARAVLLVGPPGVGKTHLAWEVARRWRRAPHPHVVGLDHARTAADLVGAVAEAVGVSRAAAPDVDALVDRIGLALASAGAALVVLDNLEQLEPGALAPVAAWRAAAPGLCVVGTSRHAAPDLADAVRIEVPPLRPEVACALFTARARRAWAAFEPDAAVAALCERLDHLPLAIEIAAARTAVLPVPEILERLSASLGVLRASDGRSLEGALRWSWGLLSPEERDALGRCTVFVDGFDAAAAEAVLGDAGLDRVHALTERSLIQAVRHEGRVRLRLLSGIRAFAEARAPAEARREARDRHLRWFAARVAADPQGTVRTDAANAVAALEHALSPDGDADLAAELATALSNALGWRAGQHQREDWLRRALAREPSPVPRARVRGMLAFARKRAGADAEAEALLAAVDADAGAPGERAFAAMSRGAVALIGGDLVEARARFEAALAEDLRGHEALERSLRVNLGQVLLRLGHPTEAGHQLRAAVALAERTGHRASRANALAGLALVADRLGRAGDAEGFAAEALAGFRAIDDREGEANVLGNLAIRRLDAGRHAEAAELLERCRALAEAAGERATVARVLHNLGMVRLDLGDLPGAVAALRGTQAHWTAISSVARFASLVALGAVRRLAGEPEGLDHLREAAALPGIGPEQQAVAAALLALATDDPDEAARAASLARERAEPLEHPVPRALAALTRPEESPADVLALAARDHEVRLGLALRSRRFPDRGTG